MMKEEIDRLKEEEKKQGWSSEEKTSTIDDSCQTKSSSDTLVFGVLLIILGVAFFFGRFSGLLLRNWWAWFILVPALMKLVSGLRLVETKRGMTSAAASMVSGSLFMILLGSMFLFGLSWTLFWPFALIFMGLNGVMWAFVQKST